MPLPVPEPGLVIHYEFLWRDESRAGREYGRKRRPCAIIVAARTEAAGTSGTSVVVAPVTHAPPASAAEGVEIPPIVKRHLGLDWERAWVIVSDLNQFTWPGFDLHPIPGQRGRYHYGFLPPKLFQQVKTRILALDAALRRPTARE